VALPFSTVFDLIYTDNGTAVSEVPPYSARGLKGTLTPIAAAQGSDKLRRTVNGTLIDISAPQMRKYQLEASGDDMDPPAFDGLWVGMEVLVYCHVEIGRHTASGSPERTPVPGSVRTDGAWTFYRPQLTCRVVELQIERAEWDDKVSWALTLEEV
jgi:hypothetical protein